MAEVAQPTLGKLTTDTKEAHERIQQEQRELARMIEQSRGEVEKLAQRNAAIAAHLRQLQGNFERLASHLQRTLTTLQALVVDQPEGDGTSVIVRVIEAQESERQRLSR